MKGILIAIISFLSPLSFFTSPPKIVVQNIPFVHSLQTVEIELEGLYELEYTSTNEVIITTFIDSKGFSDEVIDYAIQSGYFGLASIFDEKEGHLKVRQKRINTIIYDKGKRFTADRTYNITLPAGVALLNCNE